MRSAALASLLALAVAVSGNSWLDCTRVALLLAVPSLVQGGGCHVRDVRGAVQLVDSAAGESCNWYVDGRPFDWVGQNYVTYTYLNQPGQRSTVLDCWLGSQGQCGRLDRCLGGLASVQDVPIFMEMQQDHIKCVHSSRAG